MADFAELYLQRLTRHNSQPYSQNMISTTRLENFTSSDYFFDSFLLAHNQPQFPPSQQILNSPPHILHNTVFPETKKQKLELQSTTTSTNISPSPSSVTGTIKNNNSGRSKKGKYKEKQVEKLEDKVIHVRAKRGQATDSHSIAERVRREKINKKLRCLQDIVPGCHKSMGMAVMLEEIINYVHSLQNQVEFLSMELAAAASSSYDFNLEKESSERAQVITTEGALETQKWLRERFGDMNCYQSTWFI